MRKIAILASGSGSNAEQIVHYFSGNHSISVELILTNNPVAGVVERAKRLGIPCKVFTRQEFQQEEGVLRMLKDAEIDYIILAGFLWLVPPILVESFHHRMLNIHPALLPAFGGKGYYGMNVHRAVIELRSPMSGITIHYVNERFDEGDIIFQAACHVDRSDTPEQLARKIHALEHRYFPVVIEKTILNATA